MITVTEVQASGATHQEALQSALKQLGVANPAFVDVQDMNEGMLDDLLPGAEALPGTTLRARLKTDVLAQRGKECLATLLLKMGITGAQIEVLHRRGQPTLNVLAGGDNPLVIGREGYTLDCLQHLVNRMINKGSEALLLTVDSEGYREKRYQRLEAMAQRAVRQAVERQRPVTLPAMPPGDRKFVHMLLRGERGIHTLSQGIGLERHIVVSPGTTDIHAGEQLLKPAGHLRPARRGAESGAQE